MSERSEQEFTLQLAKVARIWAHQFTPRAWAAVLSIARIMYYSGRTDGLFAATEEQFTKLSERKEL